MILDKIIVSIRLESNFPIQFLLVLTLFLAFLSSLN